jgi:hypothetical protein
MCWNPLLELCPRDGGALAKLNDSMAAGYL